MTRTGFLVVRLIVTAAVFSGFVVLDGVFRGGRPVGVRRTVTAVRARWTPARLALVWSALIAYHVTYFAYHNLKSWDVFGGLRDQTLLGWDRWLFLRHSPAVVLHDLLGQHVAAWILRVWYESVSTLVILAFSACWFSHEQHAMPSPACTSVSPRSSSASHGGRLRTTTIVLPVYIVGTMTAAVYLGWHYAVGDVAGLAIAALSCWLGPYTVGAHRPRPASHDRALHRAGTKTCEINGDRERQ